MYRRSQCKLRPGKLGHKRQATAGGAMINIDNVSDNPMDSSNAMALKAAIARLEPKSNTKKKYIEM